MRVLQNTSDKPVVGVAFDADGRTLFAGGYGGVQVWPVRGKAAPRIVEHPGAKTLYAFEPDATGKYLFLSNPRSGFRAHHLPTGHVWQFPDDEQHVISLSVRPGGTHFVVSRGGGGCNRAECWKVVADGRFEPVWRLGDGAVTTDFGPVYLSQYRQFHEAVRYSPDGRTLAVVTNRYTTPHGPHVLTLHDPDTGKQRRELGTFPITVGFQMRFTPDGARLIGWEERWAELWNVKAGKQVARLTPPGRAHFRDLAVHPSGRWFVTVGSDGKARGWGLYDYTDTTMKDLGAGKLHAVAFSPNGNLAAAGADGGKVVLWDVDP